jgi:hypothetical protein
MPSVFGFCDSKMIMKLDSVFSVLWTRKRIAEPAVQSAGHLANVRLDVLACRQRTEASPTMCTSASVSPPCHSSPFSPGATTDTGSMPACKDGDRQTRENTPRRTRRTMVAPDGDYETGQTRHTVPRGTRATKAPRARAGHVSRRPLLTLAGAPGQSSNEWAGRRFGPRESPAPSQRQRHRRRHRD